MADFTLTERHARIGRMLDEIEAAIEEGTILAERAQKGKAEPLSQRRKAQPQKGGARAELTALLRRLDKSVAAASANRRAHSLRQARALRSLLAWLPALLAFARAEWEDIGTDVAHYEEIGRLGVTGALLRDARARAETPLARLESALAPLMGRDESLL